MLLSAAIIMRDGERGIKRCLESLREACDEVIVVDTGSVDGSIEVANSVADNITVRRSACFFQGSRPAEFNFADARNEALAFCNGDWVLSIDDDEELVCDIDELRATLARNVGCIKLLHHASIPEDSATHFGVIIRGLTNGQEQCTHAPIRLFRREGATWKGRIHETIFCKDGSHIERNRMPADVARLDHHADDNCMEDRRARNMTMLVQSWYADHNINALFYLGANWFHQQRHIEAIGCFMAYIAHGKGDLDHEMEYMARVRSAICFMASNMPDMAEQHLSVAVGLFPEVADAYYSLGDLAMRRGEWKTCRKWYECVRKLDQPQGMAITQHAELYTDEFLNAVIGKMEHEQRRREAAAVGGDHS